MLLPVSVTKRLGHGAELGGVGGAGVQLPCGLAQKGAGGLQFDLHIGQPELQRLELIDGFAKGFAVAHVCTCFIQRGLRGAQRAGGNVQTAAIQPRHRICETFSLFPIKLSA